MNIDLRLIKQIRRFTWRAVLTICLGVLGGGAAIYWAQTVSKIITRAYLGGANIADVLFQMKALFGIILFRAIVLFGSEITALDLAIQIKAHLREMVIKHIYDLGPAYTSRERTGELVSTAMEGIEALESYFSQYLPQLLLAALLPLMILVSVFQIDLLSGIILLLTAPLIPFFMVLIGKASENVTHRQWRTLTRMSAFFLDTLQGLTTLKLLNQSLKRGQKILAISEAYRQTTMGILRVTFLSALALEMLATLSTAIVAVEIGLRLLKGGIAFEEAFFILIIAPEFYLPLRQLGSRFHSGMNGITAGQKIFAIIETKPEFLVPSIATHHKQAEFTFESNISFHQVTFTYFGCAQPALDKVNIEIIPGQTTVLVGPSGAGKSTIVQLLLQFYQPQSGQIFVDEMPLDHIGKQNWRSKIAWVPQKPYLFNDTVAANIALSNPRTSFEEIKRSARLSFAEQFIETLPQGYNTIIGERGVKLSGGQAQCIALSRAFLKNAPILIMDEPSASLDLGMEASFQKASKILYQERTVILIAHRTPTIIGAQQIIILEKGKVAETGTHQRLVDQGGKYAKMAKAWGVT